MESDVLVIGSGVAGCRVAIAARQRGVSVVVADRGFSKRSGAGGKQIINNISESGQTRHICQDYIENA